MLFTFFISFQRLNAKGLNLVKEAEVEAVEVAWVAAATMEIRTGVAWVTDPTGTSMAMVVNRVDMVEAMVTNRIMIRTGDSKEVAMDRLVFHLHPGT